MDTQRPVLGLICARGGSKGVPGKNIKEFCGKPLIAWSIEVAQKSKIITDVVVSTDDQNIADIAQEYGAEIPFLRPDHLAGDTSKQIDAISHMLRALKDMGREYSAIALLQPTCPLRSVDDVDGAIDLFFETQSDTVISVTEEEGVLLSTLYNLNDEQEAERLFQAPKQGTIRQDFKPIYHRCGIIYVLKPDYVIAQNTLYGEKVSAYIVAKDRSFDIDNQFDWDLTSMLMDKQLKDK